MRYPTRNGISIPIYELDLPPSNLDPLNPGHLNNHHSLFTKRAFGRSILLSTVRNLAVHQFDMLKDQHAYLHAVYEPPEPPTPRQAMNVSWNELLMRQRALKYVKMVTT